MGSLVADLAQRGLLDTTMVVWMGEFGRTPRINQNAGRDHWPRSWSVVMGGGGIKGGQAVGDTDKDGVDIVDRPVGVMDVVATMTKTMGIDLATQYTTPRGRPDEGRRRRQARSRSCSAESEGRDRMTDSGFRIPDWVSGNDGDSSRPDPETRPGSMLSQPEPLVRRHGDGLAHRDSLSSRERP